MPPYDARSSTSSIHYGSITAVRQARVMESGKRGNRSTILFKQTMDVTLKFYES
jgi:hypothetical protein